MVAGKTTLVQGLASKLKGKNFTSPIEVIRPFRNFFDKQPEIVRRAYYSLGNYLAAELLARECERCPVVLDRCVVFYTVSFNKQYPLYFYLKGRFLFQPVCY